MQVAVTLGVMERLLARHFGLVKLAGVGLVVFFAGSALTTFVGAKLLMDVDEVAIDPPQSKLEAPEDDEEDSLAAKREAMLNERGLAAMATKADRKQSTAESVTTSNIFCPTCAPLPEPDEVLLASNGLQTGEVASRLPLQLLATMESDDPAWSMATIRDLDSNSLAPYTANEQIRPGVSLLSVERGRVILLNQGRREYIMLGDEPKAAPPPRPAATPANKPQPTAGKTVAIEGAEQAINCSSEHTCTVDRKFVESLLADPRKLMTQARMMPITRDGETAGFRVSRVRKGSLATLIGLENGDVVSEINGQKLGTIDDAMAMYAKLRRANHLSVVVERGGAVVTKEISIK